MKKLLAGITTALLAAGLAVVGGVVPASAHPAHGANCIGDDAISYSYDAASNSGVVTVSADQAGSDGTTPSSGELCAPLYVTATSWNFETADVWPLSLDAVNALPAITGPGEYSFGAPVECGKGIIYASREPIGTPSDRLVGPNDPFSETWLQDLFHGPDTYVLHDTGCKAPTPVSALAEAYAETCVDETDATTSGYIEVQWADNVTYAINGTEVTSEFTDVAPGDYTVTATAHDGYVLEGDSKWKLTVKPADCAVTPPPTPEVPEVPEVPPTTPEIPEIPELPELPTFAVFEAGASAVAEQCVPGSPIVTPGYIDVVFPEGAENAIQYFVGDRQLTETRTQFPAGTYTVSVAATLPGDQILGLTEFNLTIAAASGCDLPTLAATGIDSGGAGTLAAGLLLLGGTALLFRHRKPRTN
jgi:LPXTG-motif cell wall-anchored protein